MNCFQICIFAGDLATDNHRWWLRYSVVNCFQICIFAGDLATGQIHLVVPEGLWIAFKFVSLQEIWQQLTTILTKATCCELLSNLYLCRRFGNSKAILRNKVVVVNCFQICIFAGDLATGTPVIISTNGVVNCFQICIFAGDLATSPQPPDKTRSCELLSNLYLCRRFGNLGGIHHRRERVVNCFQICIFAGDLATLLALWNECKALWIAFKFVSLQEIWQLPPLLRPLFLSCELLSNLYLCRRFGNLSLV